MRISDWSSDVCSSDLGDDRALHAGAADACGVDADRRRDGDVRAQRAVKNAPAIFPFVLSLSKHRSSSQERAALRQAQGERGRVLLLQFAVDQTRQAKRVGTLDRSGEQRIGQITLARSEEHTTELQKLIHT